MTKLARMHFKRTEKSLEDDVAIDNAMLFILGVIDQNKSLREVYHDVGMDFASFKKAFRELYQLNLVERVSKEKRYLGKKVLSQIKGTLNRFCGPISILLFQQAIADKGFEEDRIPKDQYVDLVLSIARQIPVNKQKLEFEKSMLHGKQQ